MGLTFFKVFRFSLQTRGICFSAVSIVAEIDVVVDQELVSVAVVHSGFSGQLEAKLFFAYGYSCPTSTCPISTWVMLFMSSEARI